MSDELRRLALATAAAAGLGLLGAAVLCGETAILHRIAVEIGKAAAASPRIDWKLPLIAYGLTGALLGWGCMKLSERVAGFTGEYLLAPLTVATLLALGGAVWLNGALGYDLGEFARYLLGGAAAIAWIVGAANMFMEKFG